MGTLGTGGVDLAALLYLNPELAAFSNAATLQGAAALVAADRPAAGGPGALAALACSIPATPPGFDARVYLSAQPDVSGANQTIRAAMLADGQLTQASLERRGTYVSTLMEDVVAVAVAVAVGDGASSPASMRFASADPNEAFAFGPSNLRRGDRVRLQRQGGRCDVYHGVVDADPAPTGFSATFESAPAHLGCPPDTLFTLLGILVYDAERQALVAFSRNLDSNAPGYVAVDAADVVPRSDFSLETYRAVYPDVRHLSLPDAYLDYRARWKRRNEYRVIKGKDVFNLSAPYTSNLLFGAANGQNFAVFGDLSTSSNALRVSSSNAYYDGNLLVGDLAGVEAPGSNADPARPPPLSLVPRSNATFLLVVSPSNLLAGHVTPDTTSWLSSGRGVDPSWPLAGPGPLGERAWNSSNLLAGLGRWLRASSSNADRLLSVTCDADGAEPCLAGGAVDLAGGFVHATPSVLAVAGGAAVVTRTGDLVCGGDRSNLAVLNSNCVATVCAGCATFSASNLTVADYLTVGLLPGGLASGSASRGRLGIGMECLGDEGARPDGWAQGDSDPANFALETRLAVAGDIFATGTVVTLSDARCKADVRPIDGALARALRLRGVTFAKRQGPGPSSSSSTSSRRRHTGLLAQDVEAAMPEAVYRARRPGPAVNAEEGEQGDVSSVAYGNLVGLLVEALRELSGRVDDLDTLASRASPPEKK